VDTPSGADGGVLYRHELSEATHVSFDMRVPAGEAQALFVPLPAGAADALSSGASLDAVLYYRNLRTTYFQAAVSDMSAIAPTTEIARAPVQTQ